MYKHDHISAQTADAKCQKNQRLRRRCACRFAAHTGTHTHTTRGHITFVKKPQSITTAWSLPWSWLVRCVHARSRSMQVRARTHVRTTQLRARSSNSRPCCLSTRLSRRNRLRIPHACSLFSTRARACAGLQPDFVRGMQIVSLCDSRRRCRRRRRHPAAAAQHEDQCVYS